MKTLSAWVAALLLSAGAVAAQDATAPVAPTEIRRSPEELEKLLAPIALYPDALIAIVLPAATAPADVVLAARQLRDTPNDMSQIEHRAWDESVKSLTHYPAVLAWMDENLAWTKQVGEAFATQPADVMQAMQRLRAQARAAGTLTDTPQQQVIAEPDVIRIVPAQPDVIYVPYYEPDAVFVSRPYYAGSYPRPFLSFGIGVGVGSWLAFECDWRRHTIWIGNRHRAWTPHDWSRPLVIAPPIGAAYVRGGAVRAWRPPPQVVRTTVVVNAGSPTRLPPPIARPSPIARAELAAAGRARPTVMPARQTELGMNPSPRRARSETSKDPVDTTAATTSTAPAMARAAQPTVTPPAPTAAPTVISTPERPRENRIRHETPRTHAPAATATSPASPAPTSAAQPQPARPHVRPSPPSAPPTATTAPAMPSAPPSNTASSAPTRTESGPSRPNSRERRDPQP